jgi:hypothetical protein
MRFALSLSLGLSSVLASLALVAAPAGCGSSHDTGTSSGGNEADSGTTTEGGGPGDSGGGADTGGGNRDSGTTDSGMAVTCPSQDAGSPSGYPATHAPFPAVPYGGGRLITAPEIVTVTWPGFAYASQVETFGDQITQSCWWDAVRESYCGSGSNCIQRGTVPAKPHARLTSAAPSSFTDSSQGGGSTIQTFIQQQVASGALPAPDKNTLYVLYIPSSTAISLDGQAMCQSVGGWHNITTVTPPGGSPTAVPYAIVGDCSAFPGFGSEPGEMTYSASHEISEAVTDTDVGGMPGYYLSMASQDSIPWQIFGGGEIGDLCVDQIGTIYGGTPTDRDSVMLPGGSFTVQRIWSAKAAAAGGDRARPWWAARSRTSTPPSRRATASCRSRSARARPSRSTPSRLAPSPGR